MNWIPASIPPPEYRTLIGWITKNNYGFEPYCSTVSYINGKWVEVIRSHSADLNEIDDWTIDEQNITVSHYIIPEPPK